MRTAVAGATLVAAVASTLAAGDGDRPRPGFHVRHGRLYDAADHEFVMRGVGHSHASYPDRTARMLADVRALGANTVRIELSTGATARRNGAADVAHVIALCRRNGLVCVLVVADTTGWGHRAGAIPQSRAVDYWIAIRSALTGQERSVIIDVANEPYVLDNVGTWQPDTTESIRRLRQAGLRHTLLVDAPDWGQDLSFTMRDHAAAVFAADPDRNTIFSIHVYGAFCRATTIHDYLSHYLRAGLPIAVTEFAYTHHDGDVDEDAVMSETHASRVGYLAWSWSGNTGDAADLDMATNFDATALTWWGRRVFDGPDGIAG
jgi:mannan endo-1,4-beta-mannosidase